ncbi:ADP-ribosylglycohydrolase family protein [Staphylococcus capitis]|nr:ADP-ribosylglycohydrolase family protein [Staphylococcus capitis]
MPFEFRTRDSFSVTDMVGYGTYDLPPGTWSDDTSMTLSTLAHLNEQTDLEDLMQKFVAWTTKDYMTTHSGMFDIGKKT